MVEASLALEDALSDPRSLRDARQPPMSRPTRSARAGSPCCATRPARTSDRASSPSASSGSRRACTTALLRASRTRSTVVRSRTTRSTRSCATRAIAARGGPPGTRRRRSGPRAAAAGARARTRCATRRRAASATATTSRCRSSCRSSTRAGCSACSTGSSVLLGDAWAREKARDRRRAARAARHPRRRAAAAVGLRRRRSSRTPPLVDGDALEAALAGLDPLAVSRAYFDALGDPIEDILARSDLYPRDAQEPARVLHPDRPRRRRAHPREHRAGRALARDDAARARPRRLRRRDRPRPAVAPAQARAHLRDRGDRDAARPPHARSDLPRARSAGSLAELADDPFHRAFIRRTLHVLGPWVQVMTRFERELYADPDADLGTIWWDLVERHQLVAPARRRPARTTGRRKIHIALAPVYYQNYLLGEITASQLEWALERETGSPSPAARPAEAGPFLRDRFMRFGASLRWDELIEHATGSPLVPDHFAALSRCASLVARSPRPRSARAPRARRRAARAHRPVAARERLADQPVGEPRVLRQQRAVHVGAEHACRARAPS